MGVNSGIGLLYRSDLLFRLQTLLLELSLEEREVLGVARRLAISRGNLLQLGQIARSAT
jgi:hypothetical protein